MPCTLPHSERLVAVCAHPDDESFGLGAVLSAFVTAGTRVDLVCLTRGEDSTLGAGDDLVPRRTDELRRAADVLGIRNTTIHHHPDGGLDKLAIEPLVDDVVAAAGDADALLTYDDGGITGHPDHQRATDVALAAGQRLGVPVWGWALSTDVAATLHEEFGAPFVGRDAADLDITIDVDRTRQRAAMACHASQLTGNPVPERRLELQGDREHLRGLTASHDETAR